MYLRVLLFPVFFLLLQSSIVAQNASIYQKLKEVNSQWVDHPGALTENELYWPAEETERIALHLQLVENYLRNHAAAGLDEDQKTARKENLDILQQYIDRRVFPVNTNHPGERKPYFIDDYGTACAVGYLVMQSGQQQLAERVQRTNNYIYIEELAADRQFQEWQSKSGLTMQELAWIQPTYGYKSREDYGPAVAFQPACMDTILNGVHYVGPCYDGKLNGTWYVYDLKKKDTLQILNYRNGIRNGYFKQWAGIVCNIGTYVDGLIEGELVRREKYGNYIERIPYHKGMPHGKAVKIESWRITESNYVNGKLDGLYKEVHITGHDSGEVLTIGNYEKGLKEGEWIEYEAAHPELPSRGEYKAGLRNGHWKLWANTTRYEEGSFENGKREGKFIFRQYAYQSSGGQKLVEVAERHYKNDRLHGISITLYNDGQKRIEENYKESRRDGWYKDWYPNGQLRQRCRYENERIVDTARFWHQNGELQQMSIFRTGQSVYQVGYREDGTLLSVSNWKSNTYFQCYKYRNGGDSTWKIYDATMDNQYIVNWGRNGFIQQDEELQRGAFVSRRSFDSLGRLVQVMDIERKIYNARQWKNKRDERDIALPDQLLGTSIEVLDTVRSRDNNSTISLSPLDKRKILFWFNGEWQYKTASSPEDTTAYTVQLRKGYNYFIIYAIGEYEAPAIEALLQVSPSGDYFRILKLGEAYSAKAMVIYWNSSEQ